MSLPRAGLLVCIALCAAVGVLLLLRTPSAPPAPALERSPAPEPPRESPAHVQLEDPVAQGGAVELPPAPVAAPDPSSALLAEGVQRGWQLPVGKAWWTDTLINPDGREPAANEIASLQAQERHWIDQLTALRVKREQRRDIYANQRVAAGLAVEDPQGVDPAPEGKEHVVVNTHTPEEPSRFWRVDIGPGDDAELDHLDRQLASVWCEAVTDLRKRFGRPPR
jgi:hypothetical protein